PAPSEPYPLSLHDALPIYALGEGGIFQKDGAVEDELHCLAGPGDPRGAGHGVFAEAQGGAMEDGEGDLVLPGGGGFEDDAGEARSEEHTSELQSRENLVCR